jgi:activating signal cointegrator 1
LSANTLLCLSLWQPYASLIFAGVKKHETRGWKLPVKYIGVPVGIHATTAFPPLSQIPDELQALCRRSFGAGYADNLPRGAVLGTVVFTACQKVEGVRDRITKGDLAAGDWRDGRFCWRIGEVRAFAEPVPARGLQGFWRYPRTAG